MTTEQKEKTCGGCGLSKPVADFYANKGKAGGYQARCKACQTLRHKRLAEAKAQEREREAAHVEACRRSEPYRYTTAVSGGPLLAGYVR